MTSQRKECASCKRRGTRGFFVCKWGKYEGLHLCSNAHACDNRRYQLLWGPGATINILRANA